MIVGRLIPAGTGAHVAGVKRVASERDSVLLAEQQAQQEALEAARAEAEGDVAALEAPEGEEPKEVAAG